MKNAKFLAPFFLYIFAPLFFSVQAFGQTWLDATIRGSSIKKETSDRYKRTLEFDVLSRPYDVNLLPRARYLLVFPNNRLGEGIRWSVPEVVAIRDGMNLSKMDLSRQSFANVEIRDVNFSEAYFNESDFRQCVFVRCNFSKAWLADVKTDDYTKFIDCNFEGAGLRGKVVKGIPPEQIEQIKARKPLGDERENLDAYSGDYFPEVAEAPRDFTGAVITGAFENLTGKEIACSLSAKRKDYSDFCVYANNAKTRLKQESEYLDFKNYDFSNAMLYNCGFSGVDFTGASFENAVLNTVSFSHCVVSLEQIKSTWNYRNRQLEVVSLPEEIRTQLDREEFYNSESFKEKRILANEYNEAKFAFLKQVRGSALWDNPKDPSLVNPESSVLKEKCFYYPCIDGWNLSGMDLSDSLIVAVSAQGTDFTDAEIEGAYFQGRVQYMLSDYLYGYPDGMIVKEQLESTASYKRKRLRGVKFGSIFNLTGVDFSNCDLTNSIFHCNLIGVDLTDAVITGCVMHGASAKQIKSTWNFKHNQMEGIDLLPTVRDEIFRELKTYDE